MSPVVLAAILGRVLTGEGGVPLVAVTLAIAPLLALLVLREAPENPARTPRASDVAIVVASTLLLAANLMVLGDLTHALGVTRAYGIVSGALVAVTALAWPRRDRWGRLAIPLGALGLVVPVAIVMAFVGAPWTVWSALASRPALTFDDASPWVTAGHTFRERTRLAFDEPHRVVAAAPATWRVIERDAPGAVVREWRVGVGDGLTLRPGDELVLDGAARVRFEAGRRIPGSPVSGIAWAVGRTPPPERTPLAAVGLVVTIIGGALGMAQRDAPAAAGLIGNERARRVLRALGVASAPVLVLLLAVAAAAWGLYSVAVAPELTIAPSAIAGLVEGAGRLLPEWGVLSQWVAVGGVVLLFVGFVTTWPSPPAPLLRAALGEARAVRSPAVVAGVSAGIVIVAAMVALHRVDAWQWFVWALGLSAAAAAAPRLALGGPRGEALGSLVGGLVFAVAVIAPDVMPTGLRPLDEHPVLLAAPLAWMTARLARSRGRVARVRASAGQRGVVRSV